MKITFQIAKNFKEVYFGGNWTGVNIKDSLAGITWQQATTKVENFNTISVLVFHINYYVGLVIKVLQGGLLDGHDKFSFDLAPITCEAHWESLKNKNFEDAEQFANLVELLEDDKLNQPFAGHKYGNYYKNLNGVIEHAHYHLGQIVLLKKMILEHENTASIGEVKNAK